MEGSRTIGRVDSKKAMGSLGLQGKDHILGRNPEPWRRASSGKGHLSSSSVPVPRNPWKPREGADIGEGLDYFFLGCYSLELEPCPPVLFLHLCSCSLNLRADLEWSLQEAQDVCRGISLDERPALSTWLATDQEDYSAHCCPKPWKTWESPGQKVTLKPYDQVHEKLKCPLKIELTKELSL